MFKENDQQEAQSRVKEILGVESVAFEPKYLGLPTPSGAHEKRKIPDTEGKTWEEPERLFREIHVSGRQGSADQGSCASTAYQGRAHWVFKGIH
ncbi:unnamed protein product [Urochloa humidicola]